MPFVHTIRARYSEVDVQKVVFNGHWLNYFDDASTRFFESLGFDPRHLGFEVMVVRATLDFRGSAGFDDVVRIEVTADRLGNKSFDLRFRSHVDGVAACEGVITYVCVTLETRQSEPIPPLLRERLVRTLEQSERSD